MTRRGMSELRLWSVLQPYAMPGSTVVGHISSSFSIMDNYIDHPERTTSGSAVALTEVPMITDTA